MKKIEGWSPYEEETDHREYMQKGNLSHEENIEKQTQHMKRMLLKCVCKWAHDCWVGYK